jgi:hypothetical protein
VAGYELLRQAGFVTVKSLRDGGASEANPAYLLAMLAGLSGPKLVPGRPVRLVW